MKLAHLLAGTALIGSSLLLVPVAQAATQGNIVVAQNDQKHDEHKGTPPGASKNTTPPNKGTTTPQNHMPNNMMGPPHTGPNTMMGPQNHAPNNMMGPQNHMGAPNNMMGGHNTHQNFDKHSFQRNVTAAHHFHIAVYTRPHGWYDHHWVYGEILPALFWTQDYWISDYYDYGLDAPPPGFIWVRYGNDALLIDQNTGEVLQVDYGLFY